MQGDVMKESMICAKTLAWNLIPKNIKKEINDEIASFGNFGLHIHCPEAATPKDGPSAGTAITSAIYSVFTGQPIRNDIAITGEMDLDGNVVSCWSQGCLCELRTNYSPIASNSQHGFAHILVQPNGDYNVHNYQIIKGKIH